MLTGMPNFVILICMKFRYIRFSFSRYFGKLHVPLAFSEYFTIFNPFNVNVFVKHQSCLNKYKNICIAYFQPLFTEYH